MGRFILEGCVDSVESAINASKGGANRLELCSNLVIGGTTPSKGLFLQVRKNCNTKIHVLIRPRFGDFCYTEQEYNIIQEDIKMFRELGADGVVIGVLKPDGSLDAKRMEDLINLAGSMSVTLHRAFDVSKNPYEVLEQAKGLGIQTILTSGQKNHCLKGKDLIRELVEKAAGELEILVGGGVNAKVIKEIYPETKATSFHMSGKITKNSDMIYRKDDVSMGIPSLSEYEIWQTDEQIIREARETLEHLLQGE